MDQAHFYFNIPFVFKARIICIETFYEMTCYKGVPLTKNILYIVLLLYLDNTYHMPPEQVKNVLPA